MLDHGFGMDKVTVDKGGREGSFPVFGIHEILNRHYKASWRIDKFASEEDYAKGNLMAVCAWEGNSLLNVGINNMLGLLTNLNAVTAYSNAVANLGVGDSSTATTAAMTGLQAATNKTYKAMDASFPTAGTSQQVVFQSTFQSADANYAWNEFCVDNGTHTQSLNRAVSSQGTKISGQVWKLTLTITIA